MSKDMECFNYIFVNQYVKSSDEFVMCGRYTQKICSGDSESTLYFGR